MPEFVSGLELNRRFYQEIVGPIIEKDLPEQRYSAALLGHGSEVLGYDTQRSVDHHWGLHFQIFLSESDHQNFALRIKDRLSRELPYVFRGYSTNFTIGQKGIELPQEIETGPVKHRIDVTTVKKFIQSLLKIDPDQTLEYNDWLAFPQQELLGITRGEVFYDGLGKLTMIRRKFNYFPDEIWKYMLACQWMKISQQEAFPGRCAEVGDDLGSRLITARLAGELARLCFLMERTYWPYSKWFGSAFSRLGCHAAVNPTLSGALKAVDWPERESYLSRSYEYLAAWHNQSGITRKMESKVSRYFERPYQVIHAERFAAAILETIRDERVKNIKTLIGSVDQFADSTDFLIEPGIFSRIKTIWD